jgi:flagellar protein FlgJ
MTAPAADAGLTASSTAVYTDLRGLASLKKDARAQDPEAVRKVAQQFESIFAKMVLSSMRQASSSFGDSLFGSDQQQFYQGMFDDQLSVELTKGKGLGLADMLVQQLTRSGVVKGDVANGAASGSAEMKRAFPIQGNSGANSDDSSTHSTNSSPVSSTLLGTTSLSALNATADFIKKMVAADAEAPQPQSWQAGSPEAFVRELWPCAQEAGRQLGVDPRNLLAQAALETGWGKSLPCDTNGTASFNFFGVKATGDWQGGSVSVKTLEFEGGVPVPRQAKFRSYDSAADGFRDYVELLRNNPRYADALNTGNDSKAFATALQKGGYATDPAYAQKIMSIAQNLATSQSALKSGEAAPIPLPDKLALRP